MRRIIYTLLVTVGMLFGQMGSLFAQCAMCRATIENNVSNGDTTVGAGLNMGILYLLIAPYLLISIIAFFWFRNARSKKKKLSY
ncbi:hypothetical protein [Negadavirga shengliensis]|uniref:Uncharacterized protein n=1 Tax=Negadavirga shengliensis TaxID=1389218 RepID=A0ABV9SUX2_9BACT